MRPPISLCACLALISCTQRAEVSSFPTGKYCVGEHVAHYSKLKDAVVWVDRVNASNFRMRIYESDGNVSQIVLPYFSRNTYTNFDMKVVVLPETSEFRFTNNAYEERFRAKKCD